MCIHTGENNDRNKLTSGMRLHKAVVLERSRSLTQTNQPEGGVSRLFILFPVDQKGSCRDRLARFLHCLIHLFQADVFPKYLLVE